MRTNSSKDIVNYVSNAIFWAVGELKEYVQIVPVSHHRGVVHSKKILVHPPKNPKNPENSKKIQGIFLRIWNPYALFGSEQLLEFSVQILFYL